MVEIKHNDELGVPEFLERCVGGFPPGVLPPVAISGHRIAWARFQETNDPEWSDVAVMTLRAVCMARQKTEEEVALMLQYVLGLPVAAWWKGHGWSRRQVRASCVADARRALDYFKSDRYLSIASPERRPSR